MAKITAKTSTPILFVENIIPGKAELSGWVGSFLENGTAVPEANAYIYVYVDGFNINPPEMVGNSSKLTNESTKIISDIHGMWKTSGLFFDSKEGFHSGQSIVVQAKAPYKTMSDRSFSYNIGGTPVPIDLGITGDGGIYRPPYANESSVMGRIAYWYNTGANPLTPPGTPNFDTNNHVYVYVDGVNVLSNDLTIGEVYKNEIRGTNAVYPSKTNFEGYNLSMSVMGEDVGISLNGLVPTENGEMNGPKNSSNKLFTVLAPSIFVGVMVYYNGVRLSSTDYNYNVDESTGIAAVLLYNIAPVPGSKLYAVFQYDPQEVILGETPAGTPNGTLATFTLSQIPKPNTLKLFIDGLLLNAVSTNFTISSNRITFTTDTIPITGTRILVDYQRATSQKDQLIYSQTASGIPDASRVTFNYNFPAGFYGNIEVFKDGLRQVEGSQADYILQTNNKAIKFNFWNTPETGAIIVIYFYIAPVTLARVINFLNANAEFKKYGLRAEGYNSIPLVNYVIPDGDQDGVNKTFTLNKDVPLGISIRLFKDGYRLKEQFTYIEPADFTFDRTTNTIVLAQPILSTVNLVALISFVIPELIIGETPRVFAGGHHRSIRGTNVINTFSLAYVPKAGSLHIYYHGVRLKPSTSIYSVAQNIITFANGHVPDSQDSVVVDYEISHGSQSSLSSLVFTQPTPTGNNPLNSAFSFNPNPYGVAINPFKNGLLVDINNFHSTSSYVLFAPNHLPVPGDVIILDFWGANLFTNAPNDQLRITGNYTLEPTENDSSIFTALFGTKGVTLYPGKDEEGQFRFYINARTGYWKWTWYDPITDTTTPFKSGQHITARAKNTTPYIVVV